VGDAVGNRVVGLVPRPVITGIGERATASATRRLSKIARSARAPPPRMITAQAAPAFAAKASAAQISASARTPCTAAWTNNTLKP
jgi:hypothetical protein